MHCFFYYSRILYGTLQNKKITVSKKGQVFSFLCGCKLEEQLVFIDLVLKPCEEFLAGKLFIIIIIICDKLVIIKYNFVWHKATCVETPNETLSHYSNKKVSKVGRLSRG